MNDQEMTEQVEPKKEMKASIFTVNEAISESAGEGEGEEGGRRQASPVQDPGEPGDAEDLGVGRRQAPPEQNPAWMGDADVGVAESAGEGEGEEGGRRQASPVQDPGEPGDAEDLGVGRRQASPVQDPAWAGDTGAGVAESAGEGEEGGRRQTPPEQNPEVAKNNDAKGKAAGNGQGGELFLQQLSAIKAKLIEEKNDYFKINEFLKSDRFSSFGSYKKILIMALALTKGAYIEQLTMLCKLEMATYASNNGGDDNGKEK